MTSEAEAVWEFFKREYPLHGAERHLLIAVVKGCEELSTLEIDTGVGTLVEMGLLGRGEFDLHFTEDGLVAINEP
ncbi:hypothetical protein [Variovorax sp. MHTC-1]|uniref:hypothetical protein n=1 Tax=Variovorax sp. MHTC-1 TaxID=2495593 RepID=UPI000F88C9CA|nr:hypothetical protein [Variovorax sp. MHTC-1]RST47361.1 hypothetical protein EJI01_27975 [Variovorax sp. MHTC-1]